MKIVLIGICVFIILGLTYTGVSAWLRDRERNAAHRDGHEDADAAPRKRDDWD